MLRLRAEILAKIRSFFAEREVLEVVTPLLASAPVTDLHLQALSCRYRGPGADGGRDLFLQTSPEFAMKRLLAAGSGPIYQICKAIRDGEAGSMHNPEFTILEWYRPELDHHTLMDEIDELLSSILGADTGERLTYAEAFERHARIDPLRASAAQLGSRARDLLSGEAPNLGDDRNGWLDLLLSHAVEPQLGNGRPSFVHDWPADQAALARVTVTTSSPTPPSSDGGSRPTSRPDGSPGFPHRRSTCISWPPSSTASQNAPESRWESIGWSCWPPEPATSLTSWPSRSTGHSPAFPARSPRGATLDIV